MTLSTYLKAMPKIELHVHMEGSIRPETLLTLAGRHNVDLPAANVEELRKWYTFTDFAHFVEVYLKSASCLRTPDDIELLAREFIAGQAAQNIVYSEVTYTPMNQYLVSGLAFKDQMAAINRARAWGEKEFNVKIGLIFDIPRERTPEETMIVADWAISGMGDGVVALGLGGPEIGHPPEWFKPAFDRAFAAGLPAVPHAGETVGPASIWGAINELRAVRIGHGIHCLEDSKLVDVLRERKIPLDVCPTSNLCLKQTPDFASHPLPRLLQEGLVITLNSDDPPMFNTTLTEEYLKTAETFHFGADIYENFVLTAVKSSLLPDAEKSRMENFLKKQFLSLRTEHKV